MKPYQFESGEWVVVDENTGEVLTCSFTNEYDAQLALEALVADSGKTWLQKILGALYEGGLYVLMQRSPYRSKY